MNLFRHKKDEVSTVESELIPVQGPKLTAPVASQRSATEAARAYAENSNWSFDWQDGIHDHNGDLLCGSIEILAEVLVKLGHLKTIDGGFFPDWAASGQPDDRAKSVKEALQNK